jgi:hypothetical protein
MLVVSNPAKQFSKKKRQHGRKQLQFTPNKVTFTSWVNKALDEAF